MGNRIFAIAVLTVRSAIRLRFLISLTILLLLTVLALPVSLKGDGTPAGQIRILLYYPLSFAGILLGLSTLWASCGAMAQEIEEKQIQLVVVKPVFRFQIWLGKWLGLLFLNAVLLGFSGLVTYLLLQWTLRTFPADAHTLPAVREELLVGRRLIRPPQACFFDEAASWARRLQEEGKLQPEEDLAGVRAELEKRLRAQAHVVAPGGLRQWTFSPPDAPAPAVAVTLRFRFSSPMVGGERKFVSGTWRVGTPDRPDAFTEPIRNRHDGVSTLPIPAGTLSTTASGGVQETILVSFANGNAEESNTAIFDPLRGVELLVHASSFEANFLRGLFILFCRLGLMAALGLTAGSLFSFPVAAFTASSLVIISLISGFFMTASADTRTCGHAHHHAAVEPSAFDAAGTAIARGVNAAVGPATAADPLELISDGLLVSWKLTAQTFGIAMLLLPGCFWLLGAVALRKRELALPG